MKVMTVLGTRPEIIRLSLVIKKLDKLCDHKVVHTGQNFDPNLSDVFFSQLGVRRPNYELGISGDTFGQQVGKMLAAVDEVLCLEHPDALLILGDTNSGLCSFIAKRMAIPVYHMEAGNRCYDDRVPEEVNRRIIDHSSSILMPYTQRSKENLIREGIANNRIYVTGNPIHEVLEYYRQEIEGSVIHSKLKIEPGKFFLVTMHRAENVDIEDRLRNLSTALDQVQKKYNLPIICSLHPRTKNKMQHYGIGVQNDRVRFLEPLGLFDFVALEKSAFCVISDSGTVQEECCLFRVPNVTIRDVTERPETIDCGSNILSGANPETLLRCIDIVTSQEPNWTIPPEYLAENVSTTVIKVILGYHWNQEI
jgi:UDP-N-acetylglucosamine 2-epimerase (non-hydrolysing)